MNRNQKIALGCGGAGCLGLLVVIAASAILYFYLERQPTIRTANRNSNFNINTNNQDSNGNSSTDSSDESFSSSMSDDDKHKLFQSAGMTNDSQLVSRVLQTLGFGSGLGSAYEQFLQDRGPWALNNFEFISSVSTPTKARAYVEAHLDD